MRAGFQSNWYFNDFWGFYGNAAIAALWTRFRINRKDQATQTDDTIIQPIFNRTDFRTVKPYIDLSLGLRFNYESAKANLTFTLGWEEQVFINHNAAKPGDLVLQGLTTHLVVNF